MQMFTYMISKYGPIDSISIYNAIKKKIHRNIFAAFRMQWSTVQLNLLLTELKYRNGHAVNL